MALFLGSKLRYGNAVVFALFVSLFSLLFVQFHLEAVAQGLKGAVKKVDLPMKKRSSMVVKTCNSDGQDVNSDCKADVALGEKVEIKCHSTADAFWPEVDGSDWRKANGAACMFKPKPKEGGGYQVCQAPVSLADLGVEVVPSTNAASVADWTATFAHAEPKILEKMKVYLLCAGPSNSYPLTVELELRPEPASQYPPIAHFFDHSQVEKGKHEYTMDIYQGDEIVVKCSKASKRDPPSVEQFCETPSSVTAPCKHPVRWESKDINYELRSGKDADVLDLAVRPGYNSSQEMVHGYFHCVDSEQDLLFHVKIHPNIPTDRLTRPTDSPFPHLYSKCNPSDGPAPSMPCERRVNLNMFSYTNCTGLDILDPPDMNEAEGSFCTEPYKDNKTKCTATKKWSDIYDKPLLQTEGRLFTVFNATSNLRGPVTVYGRCSDSKSNRVLYFKYKLQYFNRTS